MNEFKILKGLNNDLPIVKDENTLYHTTDTKKTFIGSSELQKTNLDGYSASTLSGEDLIITSADTVVGALGKVQTSINNKETNITTLSGEVIDNKEVVAESLFTIKNGCGLDENGEYIPPTTSETLSATTSIVSALTKLDNTITANDNKVVHTSGNETISGRKTFNERIYVTEDGIRFLQKDTEYGHLDLTSTKSLEIESEGILNINAEEDANIKSKQTTLNATNGIYLHGYEHEYINITNSGIHLEGSPIKLTKQGSDSYLNLDDSVYISSNDDLTLRSDEQTKIIFQNEFRIIDENDNANDIITYKNKEIKLRASSNNSIAVQESNNRINIVSPEIRWVKKDLTTSADTEILFSDVIKTIEDNEITTSAVLNTFNNSCGLNNGTYSVDTEDTILSAATTLADADKLISSALTTNYYTKTEADSYHTIFAITEDIVTVTTDDTKGVSPYNTGYGYTNITINDNSNIRWVEGGLYIFVVDTKMIVQSAYRNCRVRIGENDTWKPLMDTSSICAASSYMIKAFNTTFQYKTTYQTSGALHRQTDANSNTTYPYLVNTIVGDSTGATITIDSNGYGARYSLIFPTSPMSNSNGIVSTELYSSLVKTCSTASTKSVVSPISGKFYVDRRPLYVYSANVSANAMPVNPLYQDYNGYDIRYTYNTNSTYLSPRKKIFLYLNNYNIEDMSFTADKTVGNIMTIDKISTRFPSTTEGYVYLYFLGWTTATYYTVNCNFSQSDRIYRYTPSTGELVLNNNSNGNEQLITYNGILETNDENLSISSTDTVIKAFEKVETTFKNSCGLEENMKFSSTNQLISGATTIKEVLEILANEIINLKS